MDLSGGPLGPDGVRRCDLALWRGWRRRRWGRWTGRRRRRGEHLLQERPQRHPEPRRGHDRGGGGGPVGDVVVGNIFFKSARNGTQNPAVDTIAVGDSITWAWNAAGSHTVQSTGVPPEVFRNSVVMSGATDKY